MVITQVIQRAWQTKVIPENWKRAIILPFYKGKGSRMES